MPIKHVVIAERYLPDFLVWFSLTTRDTNYLRCLVKPLYELAEYRPDFILRVLPRFRTKLISNDLRRLYFTGFLKRRRVKRKCKTKSGGG